MSKNARSLPTTGQESQSSRDSASSQREKLGEVRRDADGRLSRDSVPSSAYRPATYAEGLARLAGAYPQLNWLHQFFSRAGEAPPASSSKALVIEFSSVGAGVRQSSIETLRNPLPDTENRVVLFSFNDLPGVDRRRLDEICYALDLDPFDVRAVFEDGTDQYYQKTKWFPRPWNRRQLHYELHGETFSSGKILRLCLSRQPGHSLSAIYLEKPAAGPATTILFCDDASHAAQRQLVYAEEVVSIFEPPATSTTSTPSSITISEVFFNSIIGRTDGKPLPIFLLYMKLQLDGVRDYLASLQVETFEWWERSSFEGNQQAHDRLADIAQYLALSCESLTAFPLRHGLEHGLCHPILMGIQRVQRAVKDAQLHKKDTLAAFSAVLSAKDAETSIKAANNVTSLTKLAFVFVPLTFMTSIFGANIAEFDSGNVPASTFAALLVSTAVLSILIGWVLTWERKGPIIRRLQYQVEWLFEFAKRDPLLAFQLGVFAILRGGCYKTFLQLKIHAGMNDKHDDDLTHSHCDLALFPPATSGEPLLRRMSLNLLHRVALYTSQKGWQKDRFYKPSIRRQRLAQAQPQADLY